MRKLVLTLAAASAVLAGGALASANATTLGAPAGMRAAIDRVTVAEPVRFFRWHWTRHHYRHHRWFWSRHHR